MEQGQSRLNKPLAIAAVVVALLLGLFCRRRARYRPEAVRRARSGDRRIVRLQSMRAQNRLVPFVARYVSVVSSRQERLGGLVSAERTLILPGDVRYELDLAKLGPRGRAMGRGQQHAQRDPAGNRDRRAGGRSRGGPRIWRGRRAQRRSPTPTARSTGQPRPRPSPTCASRPVRRCRCGWRARPARQAVERSFAMPLQAAGFANAKVVARFATEGSPVTEPLDRQPQL